ncbi:MAG TPA: thioredoxin family protein [Sulfuricurvum sp.]|nr:thioredoxin family protein [Sulfuricurvum sp.]
MKRIAGILLVLAALLHAGGIHWEQDYKHAVAKAKQLHKPIFFVFSRHGCKWCGHLERTTFQNKKVISRLNDGFVNVIAYTDENDYVPRELWAPGTPALWFLSSDGTAMFQPIQGAVGAEDFLRAADIVTNEFNKQMIMKKYGSGK